MPIDEKENKFKKLKVSPLNTHLENCVHEIAFYDGKNIIYEKWLYPKENYPCGGCRSTEDILFMRVPPLNRVVKTCQYCGTTIVEKEKDSEGREKAILCDTYIMTVDEVRDFIQRNNITNNFVPPAINKLLRIKRRRRTPNIPLDKLDFE